MGTTLTGTTPATTYDSLIKVTDNGPLSGTAKYLSDGLGNDSVLALSTAAVGIGTTDPQTILNDFSTSARGLAISNSYPFLGFSDTDGGKFFIGTQANIGYIWNNGTSDIVVATNAAERLRITSSILQLTTGGTNQGVMQLSNSSSYQIRGGGYYGYLSLVAPILRFDANGSESMRINNEGQVLIGTSSAQSGTKLQVAGVFDVWSSSNTLLRSSHDGTRGLIQAYAGGGVANIGINTEGGNVGIGTNSPSYKLDVDGNVRLGVTTDAKLYMLSTGGNGNNERFYIEGYADGGTYGGGFKLATRNDSNIFNTAVTVNRNGNVGIGTDSPDGKLDVASAGNLVSTGAFTNPHLALTLTGSPVDNDSFVGITYATSDAANYGWSMGAKRESGGNGYLEIRQHFNSATGTQIARFTGNGLCFGSDTAAANALDSYEEGTFTVDITQGGTSFGAPLARSGFYTKIGRQVTISFYWYSTTGAPSLTGGIKVSGIPFTPSGNAYTASVGYYSNNGVNYSEATPHRVQWNSGTVLDLYGANSSTSWTTSVFEISGVFTYFV